MLPKEFFDLKKIPRECESTCNNCPEIKDSGYRPDYRCCTFQPRIPNYMLGLSLLGPHKSSHSTISSLQWQRFFLPEGLVASPKRWALFLEDASEDKFGKSTQVLCHFLNKKSGVCEIYQYRNAPCSTFFCRHDQGYLGQQFWDSLMIYINQIEYALSQWVMDELGIDVELYFKKFDSFAQNLSVINHKDLGWPQEILFEVWSSWYGKELDFFKEAARIVEEKKDDLISIASKTRPLEAREFDKSVLQALPQQLQNEVDENDSAEGESTPLSHLYNILISHYNEMEMGNGDS